MTFIEMRNRAEFHLNACEEQITAAVMAPPDRQAVEYQKATLHAQLATAYATMAAAVRQQLTAVH